MYNLYIIGDPDVIGLVKNAKKVRGDEGTFENCYRVSDLKTNGKYNAD